MPVESKGMSEGLKKLNVLNDDAAANGQTNGHKEAPVTNGVNGANGHATQGPLRRADEVEDVSGQASRVFSVGSWGFALTRARS